MQQKHFISYLSINKKDFQLADLFIAFENSKLLFTFFVSFKAVSIFFLVIIYDSWA